MDAIITLLTTLNSLSPIAVIGLLAVIIYIQMTNKPATEGAITEMKDNHLHELPEIAETLRRIEVKLGEEFSYIKAKLNGKPR